MEPVFDVQDAVYGLRPPNETSQMRSPRLSERVIFPKMATAGAIQSPKSPKL